MRRFLNELYRRNVVRATSAYLAFAWLMLQLAHLLDHATGVSGVAQRWLIIFLLLGLFPVLSYSWRYELTRRGVEEEETIPRPKRVHHSLATNLDRITMVMLLLAFAIAVVDLTAIEPISPHDYPSIQSSP